MDKGVSAAVMVKVKRKPSELFALGSSRMIISNSSDSLGVVVSLSQ